MDFVVELAIYNEKITSTIRTGTNGAINPDFVRLRDADLKETRCLRIAVRMTARTRDTMYGDCGGR